MEVGGEPAESVEPLPCVGGVLDVLVVQQDQLLLHSQCDGLNLLHNLQGTGWGGGGWRGGGEGRVGIRGVSREGRRRLYT